MSKIKKIVISNSILMSSCAIMVSANAADLSYKINSVDYTHYIEICKDGNLGRLACVGANSEGVLQFVQDDDKFCLFDQSNQSGSIHNKHLIAKFTDISAPIPRAEVDYEWNGNVITVNFKNAEIVSDWADGGCPNPLTPLK
ncbi:MAG: hypothetical protein K0R14_1456 [Burkholderiales bacterium]|jgi:hypothetical protein|nr:hypothetical protein [Burkholderiales bacterium]